MLVLSRKHQEKIHIGENITITILKTKGKAVRVGIEAPADIAVIRGELAAAKLQDSPVSAVATNSIVAPASETDDSAATRRLRARVGMCEASWSTESRPTSAPVERRCHPSAEVTLQRVPRKSVTQVLPRLVGDAGPLRSMVEQRTV